MFGFEKQTEYVIYTITGCGYCNEAKKLLNEKGKSFKNIVVDENNEKQLEEIKKIMLKTEQPGYEYWPKIFQRRKFIGGFTDLREKFDKEI